MDNPKNEFSKHIASKILQERDVFEAGEVEISLSQPPIFGEKRAFLASKIIEFGRGILGDDYSSEELKETREDLQLILDSDGFIISVIDQIQILANRA